MKKTEIAILGAGAGGLFLARHLKKEYILIDKIQYHKKLKWSFCFC